MLMCSSTWLVTPVFSPAGLWFPSLTVIRHVAGDEGTVWRNSAQEMEHHLQVLTYLHCLYGESD